MIKRQPHQKYSVSNAQSLSHDTNQTYPTNIYNMLNRQQQAIDSILAKYSEATTQLNDVATYKHHDGLHQTYIKPRSRTIDHNSQASSIRLKLLLSHQQKPVTTHSSPHSKSRLNQQWQTLSSRNHQNNKINYQSVSLPIVHKKLSKNRSKNKQVGPKQQLAQYFIRDKTRMESQLYRVYGDKNGYFTNEVRWEAKKLLSSREKKSKSKPKMRSKLKKLQNPRLEQNISPQKQQAISNSKLSPANKDDLQIESDDQSEQEIAVMYYERQFREKMRGQCLEELNFLYFTKNEVMKDWAQNLLGLLEKHDKQITGMRVKARYLQNFDDKFFSIGIFNSEDM